jgi:hypothetical protein
MRKVQPADVLSPFSTTASLHHLSPRVVLDSSALNSVSGRIIIARDAPDASYQICRAGAP